MYTIRPLILHMLDIPYSISNGCQYILHEICGSIPNTCICFRFVEVGNMKGIYIKQMIHLLFVRGTFIINCKKRVDDLLWNSCIFLNFVYPLIDLVLRFPLLFCIFQITVLSSSSMSFSSYSCSFFFPCISMSSFLFYSLNFSIYCYSLAMYCSSFMLDSTSCSSWSKCFWDEY